jgi:hypothetical protein
MGDIRRIGAGAAGSGPPAGRPEARRAHLRLVTASRRRQAPAPRAGSARGSIRLAEPAAEPPVAARTSPAVGISLEIAAALGLLATWLLALR